MKPIGNSGAVKYDTTRLTVKLTASIRPIFSPRAICTAAMRVMAPPKTDHVATAQTNVRKKYRRGQPSAPGEKK